MFYHFYKFILRYTIWCFDIHVYYKIIILSLLLGIYIWSLSLAQTSKNPWNFLSDKSSWQTPFNHIWVYVIEEIAGASLVAQLLKNPLGNAGDTGDVVLIPGLGRSPGEGNGNPLQSVFLPGKSLGQRDHGVKKGQTWLSVCIRAHTHTYTHTPKDGGWLPGKPTMWLEGWTFQSHSIDLQGGGD